MILTKAPLRIGLVGGGTDLPAYFEHSTSGGAVLGFTLNLHVYVAALPLSDLASERIRFTYRRTESVGRIDDLEHPVLRTVLHDWRWDEPLNVATMADLPGESGLGSSSAFTVALLSALHRLRHENPSPLSLAKEAIRIERGLLQEQGGWQDQVQSAVGGFRLYNFSQGSVTCEPAVSASRSKYLADHMLLVHAGGSRSSHVEQSKLVNGMSTGQVKDSLDEAAALARWTYGRIVSARRHQDALKILSDSLVEGWSLKLQSGVRLAAETERIIATGLNEGASAAKLCGAGSSGFVLFVAPESRITDLEQVFADRLPRRVSLSDVGVSHASF